MRFNKLDLNLLVALDALLAERSITRAATRLHLSISATSNALARLREYFGDELLVQVGRKMEPTARAEALKDPIRDILVRVDMTVSALPQFDPAASNREFRLYASDYTQLTVGRYLFALAEAQSSKVRIHFLQQSTTTQLDLERGEADLLIIPSGLGSKEHPEELLFEDDFCCVVWSGSPLAAKPLTLERYLQCAHVVMQPAGAKVPSFEAMLAARLGVQRQVAMTTHSFGAMPALVVGTHLIATLHRRLALHAVKSMPLLLKPSPLNLPKVQQAMQWHKHRTHDPGLIWLRDLLHRAVQRMEADTDTDTDTGTDT